MPQATTNEHEFTPISRNSGAFDPFLRAVLARGQPLRLTEDSFTRASDCYLGNAPLLLKRGPQLRPIEREICQEICMSTVRAIFGLLRWQTQRAGDQAEIKVQEERAVEKQTAAFAALGI